MRPNCCLLVPLSSLFLETEFFLTKVWWWRQQTFFNVPTFLWPTLMWYPSIEGTITISPVTVKYVQTYSMFLFLEFLYYTFGCPWFGCNTPCPHIQKTQILFCENRLNLRRYVTQRCDQSCWSNWLNMRAGGFRLTSKTVHWTLVLSGVRDRPRGCHRGRLWCYKSLKINLWNAQK